MSNITKEQFLDYLDEVLAYSKTNMFSEDRDGKRYIVFQSGSNHICGNIAIGHTSSIPKEAGYSPESMLLYFLENGFKGM